MKKITLASLILILSANATAGFVGPNSSEHSSPVAQVQTMHDDAWVTMQGHLVEQIGHERYLFSDGAHSVEVEIDNENFRGQQISPDQTVVLKGEVERHGNKVHVDVDHIERVKR